MLEYSSHPLRSTFSHSSLETISPFTPVNFPFCIFDKDIKADKDFFSKDSNHANAMMRPQIQKEGVVAMAVNWSFCGPGDVGSVSPVSLGYQKKPESGILLDFHHH